MRTILKIAFFLAIVLFPRPTLSSHALSPLKRCLLKFEIFSHVHQIVTDRESSLLVNELQAYNAAVESDPSRSALWKPYDAAAVEAGNLRVLSLGEGNSDYLSKLIDQQVAAQRSPDGFHAVDAAYMEGASEFIVVAGHLLKRDPHHFHGQSFDNLDLVDSDGRRRKFDEMVSGHSLAYVLDGSSSAVQKKILKRIGDHANPGSILRFWKQTLGSESLDSETANGINATLEKLKREGVIKDYRYNTFSYVYEQFGVLKSSNYQGWYVVF